MRKTFQFAAGSLVALAMVAVPATRADAALIVTEGVTGGSGDVSNVVANPCTGNIVGPALMVQGCFNSQPTYYVNLISDEEITFSGGQARVTAVEGEFSYLRLELDEGDTFSKLQWNINASSDGQVQFFSSEGDSALFDISGNGSNFFTITGGDFQFVAFRTFGTGVVEFDLTQDLRQIRLGGISSEDPPAPDVPEPTTLALFGLGLLGAGIARRRRQ